MFNWKKEDLETEWNYYDGTIFKGHAAELLSDISDSIGEIYFDCEELKEFIERKYNGNTVLFLDKVANCCDYHSIVPIIKLFLMEEKTNAKRN